MKLNPDCIRDIMLYAEDVMGSIKTMMYPNSNVVSDSILSSYKVSEVQYHLDLCIESQLFEYSNILNGFYTLQGLTPKAYVFARSIRSDTNWNEIKEKFKDLDSLSLNTLLRIAKNITLN